MAEKILVLGLSKSGISAAKLAINLGYDVYLTEGKKDVNEVQVQELKNLGINVDLAGLLGFDLKYLSLEDILALVTDKTGLDLEAAEEILAEMENGNPVAAGIKESKKRKAEAEENQLMLVQSDDSEIVRRLREVDLNTMSPIQAMVLLSELKELI